MGICKVTVSAVSAFTIPALMSPFVSVTMMV
jgi:hypothetical protein